MNIKVLPASGLEYIKGTLWVQEFHPQALKASGSSYYITSQSI